MKICVRVTDLWCTQVFAFYIYRGITQNIRMGKHSFLCGTHCLDLIYISIKYHEDILKIVYGRTDGLTDMPQYNRFFFFSKLSYKKMFKEKVYPQWTKTYHKSSHLSNELIKTSGYLFYGKGATLYINYFDKQ